MLHYLPPLSVQFYCRYMYMYCVNNYTIFTFPKMRSDFVHEEQETCMWSNASQSNNWMRTPFIISFDRAPHVFQFTVLSANLHDECELSRLSFEG